MPTQEPLSRSGITSLTGVPRDVLTFWVRQGVVRPIDAPAGTGRHLRFQWYEANIAAVMLQFRRLGFNVESLHSIGQLYRDAIAWADELEVSRDDVRAINEYMFYKEMPDDPGGEPYDVEAAIQRLREHPRLPITDRLIAIADNMDVDRFVEYRWLFLSITDQPDRLFDPGDTTLFWPSQDGWRVSLGSALAAQADGLFATISLDVNSVLYYVWNRT